MYYLATVSFNEAALLWLKNKASQELGITVNKISLVALPRRLCGNKTQYYTPNKWWIANAPGPINLVFRCQLEENGQIQSGAVCSRLENEYGTTSITLTHIFKGHYSISQVTSSQILFVQGLNDSPIQMNLWPTFKQDVISCSTCQNRQFVEIPSGGHVSLFESLSAKTEFNNFINSH